MSAKKASEADRILLLQALLSGESSLAQDWTDDAESTANAQWLSAFERWVSGWRQRRGPVRFFNPESQ